MHDSKYLRGLLETLIYDYIGRLKNKSWALSDSVALTDLIISELHKRNLVIREMEKKGGRDKC